MNIFVFDSNIVSFYLRQNQSVIEDADIFTAAFCIYNGFTLVTNNTKHFQHISGLNYCDWT
ncbi:MAG: hypothetical protein Pg6C_05520 [Treponemataceae bacterium]|nr:MAG: hypothetical protein Pg6C_05520 [Treponemataceae bacterium]